MSNDLISRKETERILRAYADDMGCNRGQYELANGILKAVGQLGNVPTALDLDNIVEQINNAITPTVEHTHRFCGTVSVEHCAQYETCDFCVAEQIIKTLKDSVNIEDTD